MSTSQPQPAWDDQRLASPHTISDKAERVRRMFDAIAPTYERVNRRCSAGRDAAWRSKAVRLAGIGPTDDVLDVACGTGDLARALAVAGAHRVVGCDFAPGMLALAANRPLPNLGYVLGDALRLPFADQSFSVVSCAFGVRNFQDLDQGLREMRRVLQPGGRLVILEFTRPANRVIRWFYELYSCRIMPVLAGWMSGDRHSAYRYLPRSVVSFSGAREMCQRIRSAGLEEAIATPLTFGAASLYLARVHPA
jgi:demethylmenaquinone methyltransferase/2-methoxy-6-polyprenyl-1,4-benzoquinol methylase